MSKKTITRNKKLSNWKQNVWKENLKYKSLLRSHVDELKSWSCERLPKLFKFVDVQYVFVYWWGWRPITEILFSKNLMKFENKKKNANKKRFCSARWTESKICSLKKFSCYVLFIWTNVWVCTKVVSYLYINSLDRRFFPHFILLSRFSLYAASQRLAVTIFFLISNQFLFSI